MVVLTLQWRHNGRDSVSNHQPYDCLLNLLFRRRSKKTSKPRVTGLCTGNSPGTGEFLAQLASYAENVSIWWLHHEYAQHSLWPTKLPKCLSSANWIAQLNDRNLFFWIDKPCDTKLTNRKAWYKGWMVVSRVPANWSIIKRPILTSIKVKNTKHTSIQVNRSVYQDCDSFIALPQQR